VIPHHPRGYRAGLIAMPFYLYMLVMGVVCLASGIAYLASPRFVEWTVTNDRHGQQWARRLGRERAIFAMRYVFSSILIVAGIVSLCVSYLNYGAA
jgi:hypothetical protein